MHPLFSLQGRTALVTGASRGLGLGMAHALAVSGAHVVLNGRDATTLQPRCDAFVAEVERWRCKRSEWWPGWWWRRDCGP